MPARETKDGTERERGDSALLLAVARLHDARLRLILGSLNAAIAPRDMNLPGLGLHELQGSGKGTWAVNVSGNWRVTFGFAGKDADNVDYEDYH